MIQIKKEDFIPLKELIQETQSEKLELVSSENDRCFEIRGEFFKEGKNPSEHVQNKVTFRILSDSIKILNIYFIDKRKGTGTKTIRWLEDYAISKNINKIEVYGVNTYNIAMVALCSKFEYEIKYTNKKENYSNYEKELT